MWYLLLALLGMSFVLSVTLPVPRRVWAFMIYSMKYLALWLVDVLLRRVRLFESGQRVARS